MSLLLCIILQIFLYLPLSQALDIPDTPLPVMVQSPPPVIMLLIDDSTSMNDSILAESDNAFLSGYHYVFNDPDNHVLSSLTNTRTVISPQAHQSWQARCCMTNRMYYDPRKIYHPWPHWEVFFQNTSDAKDADPDCPAYYPMNASCQNLNDAYFTKDSFKLSFSHYFMFEDNNTNEQLDAEEQLILIDIADHNIQAYEVIDNDVDIVLSNLRVLPFTSLPDSMTLNTSGQPMTYTSQRQNFANWFSFHRRKELSVRYYLGKLLDCIGCGWVGLYSFNRSLIAPVCLIDNTQSDFNQNKKALLEKIYTYKSYGDSPLRQCYQEIGNYLDTQSHSIIGQQSPFQQNMEGDRCRLAYVVVFTDGQYNGATPNIGNRDCDGGTNDTLFDGSYYSDPYENTFADVIMYYYEQDLALEIPNITNSEASHQHLIPLIIHFSSTDLPDTCKNCPPNCPQWPKPIPGSKETIIDLFHASINGRGLFFNADNPNALGIIIEKISSYIQDRQTVVSSATFSGQSIQKQSRLIETSYYSGDWTGDIKAYDIDSYTSLQHIPKWSAKKVLARQTERIIITYDGQSGIPFRADRMDSSNVSDHTIQNIYNQPLGDIVHASPVIHDNVLWIAANDGMVHAFDMETGNEKMAYIPQLLWPRLHLLEKKDKEHHYYIDGNLYVYKQNGLQLMAGSLGRGGKGLFCINIGEDHSQNMPMWEYAPLNDSDLGYIQQVYIVNSNYNNKPVAIFGNGYNCDNKQAYLYILDALTGKPLKCDGQDISKGIALPTSGSDNGLSTPALVDIDSNQTVDLIYAGDLQGNLWKFDCQSTNPNQWRVFYEDEYDSHSRPLFQAISKNGQAQPIIMRPEVIRHCDGQFMGYIILMGTGKYLEQQDIQDKSTQSIYCIWDWSDYWQHQRNINISTVRHTYLGSFNSVMQNHTEIRKPDHTPSNVTLQKRNLFQATNTIQSMNWDPTAAQSYIGWFMDMNPGERVIVPFTYLGENLFITNTYIPDNSPCQNGGVSHVYMINACNGQSLTEVYKNLELSVFCQPIHGILYPPFVQYDGSGEMFLFFSSSIPSAPKPVHLFSDDINGVRNIFDGQLFYWKRY
jgi:outer membrane protein assembly factor BamB